MRKLPKPALLDEMLLTLVRHFSLEKVQAALARVSNPSPAPHEHARPIGARDQKAPSLPTVDALETIRTTDPEKYQLLADFRTRLKARQTLLDSQDIRHFAQLVGLKHIEGKSRKDMLPVLFRFLATLPVDRLKIDIQKADNISEQQRQQGFSVLTDKLLGDP